MIPTTIDPAVATYLEGALASIADVRGDTHQELAEAIEEAILEVAEESEETLEDVLGDPAKFVAELRSASGFGPSAGRVRPRRFARLRDSVEQRVTTVVETKAYRWTGQLLEELQPAWWVARGFIVAFVLTFYFSLLVGPRWGRVLWLVSIPVPRLLPGLFAIPTLIAVIVISVLIGRRTYSGWRKSLVMLLNVLTVVGFLGLTGRLESQYNHFDQAIVNVPAVEVGSFESLIPITLIAPDGGFAEVFTIDEAIQEWTRLAEMFDPEKIRVVTPAGPDARFSSVPDLIEFLRSEVFGEADEFGR